MAAGELIDSLSSENDRLWPSSHWPRLELDQLLQIWRGRWARPLRYAVQEHVPGHLVHFRFTAPAGFHGWRGFEVVDATAAHCVLKHRLEMKITRPGLVLLASVLSPATRDALIEDALFRGGNVVGRRRIRGALVVACAHTPLACVTSRRQVPAGKIDAN